MSEGEGKTTGLASSETQEQTGKEASLVGGSLWKAIWTMSWPLLITTISYSLVGMTDLFVAGRLGSPAQAAVGVAEQIMFMFTLFIMATGTGTTALVARNWGAGDRGEANRYAGQSLTFGIALGIVLVVLAQIISPYVISMVIDSPEVRTLGTGYLRLFSFYALPFSIICIGNCSFRAIGDAKTPLLIVCSMAVVQITGDYLTVVYNWPAGIMGIPHLGIHGIAYSSLTAAGVGSIIALVRIVRSPLAESLRYIFPVISSMIVKIAKIGIPSAMQRMSWSLSVFGLFFILAMCPAPTEALAAWTIGMRVEGLLFMPVMALSMAVAAIVGQNLGARELERAYAAGWKVAWIGIGMLTALSLVIFLLAAPIADLMSDDKQTMVHVINYLQINAISEPFLAMGMILGGALQGAGDTKTPMWITVFSNWLVRLPLAYVLAICLQMGPSGAWWSMTMSIICMGLLTAWQFRSRRWTKLYI